MRVIQFLILFLVSALLPATADDVKSVEVAKPEDDLVPVGNLFAPYVECVYAIYLLPDSKANSDDVMASLMKSDKFWTRVSKIPDNPKTPTIMTATITDVAKSYTPPSIHSLEYFGRDISKEQAEAVQQSPKVYILVMDYPQAQTYSCLRCAASLAGSLATQLNGLIWDEATRELFSPEGWKTRRIDTWQGDGVPDLQHQIAIHAYKDGDYVRAITLGMSKFGLPDISVGGFSWSSNRQMGNLIEALAQQLAEGAQLSNPGQFDLDLHKTKQPDVRERMLKDLLPHAEPVAKLGLKKGKPEEGDDENRQLEITFDRYEGSDLQAKQDALISGLFGWSEQVKSVHHDAEIKAASDRAREKLPNLGIAFNKGLAPGEFIELKAPFHYDGGTEWMWVEVTAWKGDDIKGILKNEPFHVPQLHGGQIVDVSQNTIFDYIHRFPDGHEEGNETGALIQKAEGQTEEK